MKLSDLIQTRRHQSQCNSQSHSQTQPSASTALQRDMASALTANVSPYPKQQSNQAAYSRAPNPPPSPPVDEPNSYTLPSIHSLIGMADGTPGRTHQTGEVGSNNSQPQQDRGNDQSAEQHTHPYGQPTVSSPKALPPTPPLLFESGFDGGNQSPSATSPRSSISAAAYSSKAINSSEAHKQQQQQTQATEPYTMQRQPPQSPYLNSSYTSPPSTMSNFSYHPQAPTATSPGMYYQRPLPATFHPPEHPASVTSPTSSLQTASPIDHTNPWQHHHYIAPSASVAFTGQTQDRYICQTCNKAFSRPSSLRIHSHSHTGEKPFKCPHTGCGKAFSVRSNMKRHERGCHGTGGSPGSS